MLNHNKGKYTGLSSQSNSLSKFRASLLPIVIFNIWNVKKYGASKADPAK